MHQDLGICIIYWFCGRLKCEEDENRPCVPAEEYVADEWEDYGGSKDDSASAALETCKWELLEEAHRT